MAVLTVNAGEHAAMKHMHRPSDEKRSVVILREEEHDEWLHTTNAEAARGMLTPWLAAGMTAESASDAPKDSA